MNQLLEDQGSKGPLHKNALRMSHQQTHLPPLPIHPLLAIILHFLTPKAKQQQQQHLSGSPILSLHSLTAA